ncbi:hypothetical protein H0I57_07220 [Yersinia enterocolitica]|nr:hypothetical protein [Yersinia enterocolitica]MBW5855355.1 hypothetical protein [Yersinia enterocolitica]MBW5861162.1 hypothetical protein [Yersinia enterocolitica]MBW5872069.1 hypothetical protein [Yersinia enterocolitica]
MNAIHSVTDKALFDALCQSRVTQNELRELFLSRGVLVSKKTAKKDLAKNFSKFTHDYYLHQKIATIFGGFLRREKTTSIVINNISDKSIIVKAANELKTEIESQDDLCHVFSDKDGIKIHITYLTTNYGKSEFNQIEKRTAVFEIESLENGYSIRRPDNEQTSNYEMIFLGKIEDIAKKRLAEQGKNPQDAQLDTTEISMENIEDSAKRTEFFTQLINGLDNYDLDDVTDAYIYHPKPKVIEEEDGDIDTGVHISKASLKGEGVLKSEELTSLYERGFYIWKIRWRVKSLSADQDIYEFEAQFGDPLEFKDFSYISRGVKKYKGHGIYTKNAVPLDSKKELFFNQLIEKTAYSIIMDLNKQD